MIHDGGPAGRDQTTTGETRNLETTLDTQRLHPIRQDPTLAYAHDRYQLSRYKASPSPHKQHDNLTRQCHRSSCTTPHPRLGKPAHQGLLCAPTGTYQYRPGGNGHHYLPNGPALLGDGKQGSRRKTRLEVHPTHGASGGFRSRPTSTTTMEHKATAESVHR